MGRDETAFQRAKPQRDLEKKAAGCTCKVCWGTRGPPPPDSVARTSCWWPVRFFVVLLPSGPFLARNDFAATLSSQILPPAPALVGVRDGDGGPRAAALAKAGAAERGRGVGSHGG